MMRLISIVVLYNNTRNEVKEIVNAYKNQTEKIYRLILIDNSDVITLLEDSDKFIYYNYNSKNIGSSAGFYLGYEIACEIGYDYLWLNDSDGYPKSDCLERMLRQEKTDSPKLIIPTKYETNKKYMLQLETNTSNIFEKRVYNEASKSNKILSTTTTGMLISKKIIKDVGFYDINNFNVGYEDLDFVIRCLKKGYNIVKVDDAIYYHPDLNAKYRKKKESNKMSKYLPYNLYHGNSKRQKYSTYSLSYICARYFKYYNVIVTVFISIVYCIIVKMDTKSVLIIFRGVKNGVLNRWRKLESKRNKIYVNNGIVNYKKYYEENK